MEDSNTALLIVDVQVGFINDATRHILPKVEALQKRYKHVYATRFINADGSPYRRLLGWHRFYTDSDDVPLAFEPVDGVVVLDKYVYTCVTPAFLQDLRDNGIEEVAICGIDTDACVSSMRRRPLRERLQARPTLRSLRQSCWRGVPRSRTADTGAAYWQRSR